MKNKKAVGVEQKRKFRPSHLGIDMHDSSAPHSSPNKKAECPSPELPCLCRCHPGKECWDCSCGRHKPNYELNKPLPHSPPTPPKIIRDYRGEMIDLCLDVVVQFGYRNEKKKGYYHAGFSILETIHQKLYEEKIIKNYDIVTDKEINKFYK